MYKYKNYNYSLEEVQDAADKEKLSIDEYIKEFNIEKTDPDPDEEGKETPSQETVDAAVEVDDTASNLENKIVPQQPSTGSASETISLDSAKLTDTESLSNFIENKSQITDEGVGQLRQRKRVLENEAASEVLNSQKTAYDPIELEEVIITGDASKTKPRTKKNQGEFRSITQFEESQRRSKFDIQRQQKAEEKRKNIAEGKETLPAVDNALNIIKNSLRKILATDDQAKHLYHFVGTLGYDLNANLLGKEAADKIYKENLNELGKINAKINAIESEFLPEQSFSNIKKPIDFFSAVLSGGAGFVTSAAQTGFGVAPVGLGIVIADDMIKTWNDKGAEAAGLGLEEYLNQGRGEILQPLILAGGVYAIEKAQLKGISNFIKNKFNSSQLKGFTNLLLNGGENFIQETTQFGLEELNNNLAQGMNTEKAMQEAVASMLSKEGGIEQGLKGFFGATSLGVGGKLYNKASYALRGEADNSTIAQAVQEINILNQSKYRQGITREEIANINAAIEEIKNNTKQIFDKNDRLLAVMSDEDLADVDMLFNSVEQINKKIITTSSSTALTSQEKKIINQANKELLGAINQKIFDIRSIAERTASAVNKAESTVKLIQGTTFKTFANAEEINKFLEKENIKNVPKQSLNEVAFVYQDGNEQITIINREQAAKGKRVGDAFHEAGHNFFYATFKNNPQAAINLATALKAELDLLSKSKKDIKNEEYLKRINQYQKDFDKQIEKIEAKPLTDKFKQEDKNAAILAKKAEMAEETLTLFIEGIKNKTISYKDNVATKLADFARRSAQNFGVNIKFDTGQDVYNALKDLNASLEKGTLTFAQIKTAKEGATGKLISEKEQAANQAETVIKKSKSLTPEVTTDAENRIAELQKLKEETRAVAAKFGKEYTPSAKEQRLQKELLNIIDPVISKVAENRTKALYDKIPAEQKENVSRENYRQSLKSNLATMAVNEFTQGKQDLEAFIVNRGYLRANSLAKELGIESTEEFGGPGITSDITESVQLATEAAPETEVEVAETKPTERLIEVKNKFLSPEGRTAFEENIASRIDELAPDEFTFKKLPNWGKEDLAKELNIPIKKFEGSSNFTQAELGRLLTWIETNVSDIRRALPGAAVLEGASVPESLIGTATGVPNNLLKNINLYERLARGTKDAGLVPYRKLKGIDNSSILKAVSIIDGRQMAGPRDKAAQTAKGIFNMMAKVMTNQEIRKQLQAKPRPDITTKETESARAGGIESRLLFSKSFKGAEEIDPQIIKLGKKLNTRLTKKAIDNALVEMRNEFDGTEELFLEYKEKYFDPYIEARKKADKMPWPNAEETVLKNIKTLEKSIPNLKITQIKLNKNSQKVDIEFELAGQEVFIEVKKNEKARLSQIFLRKNTNGNTYVTKGRVEEKYINEIIKEDLKSRNILLNIIKEKYPNEIFEEKKGKDVTTVVTKDAFYGGLNALKKQNKSSEKVFQLPIDFVNSIYNAKNTYYLDFGDLGTFYMNENPQQFPVASLAQKNKDGKLIEVDVRMMWKHHKPRAVKKQIKGFKEPKTIFTISRIATPSLTAEAKQVLSDTETLSMQEEGQAAVILKFSKSKTEATTENNKELPKKFQLPKGSTNEQVLAKMQELDNEANEARIKYSKSQDLNEDFNNIIEAKTGIATYKRFSPAKAQVRGASKGKFNFFIPPSAEDFTGLLYKTLAKGKVGDTQMQWYKDNLLDPYARAMNDISAARVAMFEDYKALKNDLEIIPKDLKKKSVDEYTREQAVRVYIWNNQGNNVPGLFKTDQKDLVDYVNKDSELKLFAEQLIAIQKNDEYSAPKEGWLAGSITTDLLESVNSIKRKKYLEQWQTNVDLIFSEENMNKLEAAFGKPYVKALENILTRMKTGRNKPFTSDSLAGRVTDWLNNSVGAIMFFNTRSAVLQTISSINFVNWSDNNIYQAGKALANQPQYWKDFKFLFNSDFLKERRGGLRFNVSESEIADAAKKGGARGVVSKILQAGFLPTQMADSFAIASGGATFYRNRIKSYIKEGLTETEAQEKAFLDFREIAEESQQSSRPDRISAQQAGPLGRTILAFANTPAQYARLTKKAASDLINGRGDAKTNISKLLYYGFVQNLVFNMLQKAVFMIAFGDDDEDEKKKEEKYLDVANGMADGLLRGMGVQGAIASTLKNTLIKIIKESEKARPDYAETALTQLLGISPPIQSKAQKVRSALKSYEWNKDEMLNKGFSLDNPAYMAGANIISAGFNVPLDRVVKKVNNIAASTQEDISPLERSMLIAGWGEWELGIQKPKKKKKKKTRSSGRGTSRSNSRSSNRR